MPRDTFEESLEETAEYFGWEIEDLRKTFSTFLNLPYQDAKEQMDPYDRAVCIGLYRVTKLKSACLMGAKSRDRWRERAMELGSPGHLRKDDDGA